jgi:hypothetical protein
MNGKAGMCFGSSMRWAAKTAFQGRQFNMLLAPRARSDSGKEA